MEFSTYNCFGFSGGLQMHSVMPASLKRTSIKTKPQEKPTIDRVWTIALKRCVPATQ